MQHIFRSGRRPGAMDLILGTLPKSRDIALNNLEELFSPIKPSTFLRVLAVHHQTKSIGIKLLNEFIRISSNKVA